LVASGSDAGGPEFVGEGRPPDDPDALQDVPGLDAPSDEGGILKGGSFDVHCDIVHQGLVDEALENAWAAAIGVDFNGIADILDAIAKPL